LFDTKGFWELRFVIVASARTGSSYLTTYLSRHGEICCHGESFHPKGVHLNGRILKHSPEERTKLENELFDVRSREPGAFLQRLFELNNGLAHVGFKIFGKHNRTILEQLLHDSSVGKIVLFRPNVLAQYASLRAARKTSTWGGEDRTRPEIRFHPGKFMEYYNNYVSFFSATMETLNQTGQAYHVMRYDELNNPVMLVRLFRFIGATPTLPTQRAGVQRVRASSDIVSRFSNPEDVLEFLGEHSLMQWTHESDLLFSALSDVPASDHDNASVGEQDPGNGARSVEAEAFN
jgi:LPS sulfotransferase NodH